MSLAVVHQKGGVGKTTIAVNLAAGLVEAGKRTLLIDIDPLGSASRYLGVGLEGGCTVADVLAGRAGLLSSDAADGIHGEIEAAVEKLFRSEPLPSAAQDLPDVPGLQVVASSPKLSRMDRNPKDLGALSRALSRLDPGVVDVVVIDTPPRWGLLTVSALAAVRAVVAPTDLKPLSLMALSRLIDGMERVRRKLNPRLDPSPWLVPSRVRHTRLSQRCLVDLAGAFPGRILPSIRETTRVAEAPGFHMPIGRYAPGSIGAGDFSALTHAVLDRIVEAQATGASEPASLPH